MIAARPFQNRARGLGRNAFDLPAAALAGLAAAFLAFAMPGELLQRLVIATGLPHLLAAAAPPLGVKARILLGVAGAGAAFGLAYALLRLLDRSGRAKAPVDPATFGDGPRLRRRDAHPDAPACRPISAARDFGEPAPPPLARHVPPPPISVAREVEEPAPPPQEPAAPAFPPISVTPMDEPGLPPLELDQPIASPISVAPVDAFELPPLELDEPIDLPISIDPVFEEPALPEPAAPWLGDDDAELGESAAGEVNPWGRRHELSSGSPGRQPISAVAVFGESEPPALANAAESAVAPAPAKAAAPSWLPEPVAPRAVEPAPARVAAPSPAPAVEPAPPPVEPELVRAAEPLRESVAEPVAPSSAERPGAQPAEQALGPATETSLAELMRRLEQGLATRTRPSFIPTAQPHAPAPEVFPEANDDRLQSAIESLQRLAARGD